MGEWLISEVFAASALQVSVTLAPQNVFQSLLDPVY